MRRIECWKIRVLFHRTIRADAWLRKSPLCRLNEIALNLANVHTFSKMRNSSFCKCKFLQCIALGNQAECKCRWRKHIYLHDPVAKCMLAKLKRGNQMKSFLSSLQAGFLFSSWPPSWKEKTRWKLNLSLSPWPRCQLHADHWPTWRKGNQQERYFFLHNMTAKCQPGQLEKRKPHEN